MIITSETSLAELNDTLKAMGALMRVRTWGNAYRVTIVDDKKNVIDTQGRDIYVAMNAAFQLLLN